jgi:sialate O-acetylesterase
VCTRKGTFVSFIVFVFCTCFVRIASAEPTLPYLISDHAVFQQGREIPIWGNADPGERVVVTLAGHTASTQADSGGHWSVRLPPMTAGGPFVLQVAGKKTIERKDLMVGEVWIASGQSNMTFELGGSAGAEQELPKADYPDIRLFTVPRRVSLYAQPDTLPAAWQPCTPESAKKFSAVAYYFARDLYNKLQVPIGIVESAWPGTAIEEWIPPNAALRDPQIKPALDAWNAREGKGYVDGRLVFSLDFGDFELLPNDKTDAKPIPFADFDGGIARTPWGGTWSYSFRDAPETAFELISPGRGGRGYAARIAGRIDASDDARLQIRYRADGSPVDLSHFAGIRLWVRGEGQFRFRSLQPTVADWDDYSTTTLHATADWTQITIQFHDLRQEGWGVATDFTPKALTGFVIECLPRAGYPTRPATGLYGGMIAPLMLDAFRGVIWYQGEGNAWRPRQYRTLLPALIDGWRTESHQPEMQFLIVQLPNHGAIPAEPGASAWAEVREAQLQTVKEVPGTGLAVTIDVGDPGDLHPHRKAEVGERLAIWALGTTYKQPIVPSGPLYESMKIEGGAIRIQFKFVGGGLQAKGGELRGFAVAGADRKFHWATAQIEGNSVVVSSKDVNAPMAARYAWGDSPECNLYNADGLPASPFRTDDWQ